MNGAIVRQSCHSWPLNKYVTLILVNVDITPAYITKDNIFVFPPLYYAKNHGFNYPHPEI